MPILFQEIKTSKKLLLAQLLDCAEENETRASHDKKQHCRLLHNTMGLDRETLLDLQICAGRVAGNEERTHRVALEEKTWGATHTLPVLLLLNSMNIFDTFKGNRIFFPADISSRAPRLSSEIAGRFY